MRLSRRFVTIINLQKISLSAIGSGSLTVGSRWFVLAYDRGESVTPSRFAFLGQEGIDMNCWN